MPRLLGWPKDKTQARVTAMLELVHLDPAIFADRATAELSGGQAQRVGLHGRSRPIRTSCSWTSRSGPWIRSPGAIFARS